LKKYDFCSSSRKAIILTTGILKVFRGLKFELDAEIGQKAGFFEATLMAPQIPRNEAFYKTFKKSYFCSSPRKAIILTTGILKVFRGLKFELDAEIGKKAGFFGAISHASAPTSQT